MTSAALEAGPSAGAVAISMKSEREVFVLQSDGRVVLLDAAREAARERYRVPLRYQPLDLAAGVADGPEFCVTINSRSDGHNFLLQVMPDGKQIWTFLSTTGLFVGVAVDAAARVAYLTKPFDNTVYRLPLGVEGARAVEVAALPLAQRIGPVTIDLARRRLFVADMDGSDVFAIGLDSREVQRIRLRQVSEVRAVAWSAALSTLYVADAGQEALWSIDVDRTQTTSRAFRTVRVREPSGLAVAADHTMWLVDESQESALQLSLREQRMVRSLPLAVARASR